MSLEGSVLSPETQAKWDAIAEWNGRKERLEDRARDLRLARALADEKYHFLLGKLEEFSTDGIARAKEESGLKAIDEELSAIEALLPRLPAERQRAVEAFQRARAREWRENLARLAREQKALDKKILTALRPLKTLLPEAERIAAEGARWAQEAPREDVNNRYDGHRFPLAPLGSLPALLKYVVVTHWAEIENGR